MITPIWHLTRLMNLMFQMDHICHTVGEDLEDSRMYYPIAKQFGDSLSQLTQQDQAHRAVLMCMIYMSHSRITSNFPGVGSNWTRWTRGYQDDLRDHAVYEQFHEHVVHILLDLKQQVQVTERDALMFTLVI